MNRTSRLESMAVMLTPSQRMALIDHPNGNPTLMLGFARATLIWRGLLDYRPRWWITGPSELVMTRKGRRLRRYLLTTTQDKAA